MAQSAPLLLRIVASSVRAANRAGKIIRDVMSAGDLGIVEKGKDDLQTEADRSAQRCIITSLSQQFPGITIIGEEGSSSCEVPSDWVVTDSDPEVLNLACPAEYQDVADKDVVVWVDPLDGTSEYTQGLLDHVTVLIGVAVGDRAVGGVIHQPYYNSGSGGDELGRTLWGVVGAGVGGFVPVAAEEGRRVVTTTRSHSNQVVEAALQALRPDEIIRVGGAGHKVMLLMEGKAHAYVFASRGCKRWDTCAPEAVLEALGGRLTDLHGRRYSYGKDTPRENTGGVLATGKGQDHDWYLRTLPETIRQTLG
ncbi:3'(2'),5'-bisphosphate nucleotidase 1 [Bacillus rossius redtenbacheri]|uniref:3'(2'),5'-bisphosphate nucleotidase 1 n=1 Tax=Bacillus rossius redtenbacheri TaxID=93214 RepID=UPI002FDDE06C